ncbi:MAG: ester cyclase, partial [Chloroflexota bacterium]
MPTKNHSKKNSAEIVEASISNTHDITLHNKVNLTRVLTDPGKSLPALNGFDPKFSDFVDYIIKITHEIWEERGIGLLYEYYGTAMKIHTSDGDIFGRDKVIEATIQAMAAFPNRRLYGDEVIWKGNDQDGYYSSHRLVHEGNNWGATLYGPATGKRVSYRAIADCAVKENVIYEEWLVRDELTLVTQLGFDPLVMANRMAADTQNRLGDLVVPSEPDRLRGQLPPEEPA